MGLFRAVTIAAAFAVCAAAQTNLITQFAGSASAGPGYSGDGGLAVSAQLNMPYSVAVDSFGNVYIADYGNYVVREVSTSGIITTIAGTNAPGSAGVNGLATSAQLSGPTGIAVDASGNVYVSDGPNNRVLKITSGLLIQFAGNVNDSGGFGGDGGQASTATLNFPAGLAVDASGNLYIADAGNNRIRKVVQGVISTIAGNGAPGFGGDGGAAISAQIFAPQGVAVDSNGNVYVADTGNNRIREIAPGTGFITTIAGNGAPGYSGDKGPATNAELNSPRGVAVDTQGNVYVADTANSAVRKISGSLISTVAGTGTAGYNGDSIAATAAQLSSPRGIAVSPGGGTTYIADTNNNEIRALTNTFFTGAISQVAAGASYTTGFYVINTSSTAAGITLAGYDNNGQPLDFPYGALPSTASINANLLTDTIPAYGVAYYEAGVPTNATLIEGSVFIQSSSSILVQALFRHLSTSGVYYEAAVPSSPGSFEIELAFDGTTFAATGAQIYTGIAITNTDANNAAAITCVARDNLGNVIANAVSVPALSPLGHYAAYNFPALLGLRGTLDCTSTTKIGALALRFLGNDALSSLPVILK